MPELPGDRASGPVVDWAVASQPRRGESACGDMAVTAEAGGRYVLAVVDGLGHGPPAAEAAAVAADTIRHHPDEPPAVLLARVHRNLAGTRGAAATVAVVEGSTGRLDWVGVGNVAGIVVRADSWARPAVHGVFLGGGVLGSQMPPLPTTSPVHLVHGDRILIATDGVRADLADLGRLGLRPRELARKALDEHALPTDDALVLVARYAGRPAEHHYERAGSAR